MTVVLVQIMRSSKVTIFLKKLYRILFVLGRLIVRPELKIFLFIFFLYFISNSHEGISKEQGSSLIAIHRNIQLIALSTPPDKDFDIPVMPPKQALKVIRKSIDLIYANSPYTANRLVELSKSGPLIVIYNPEFPEWSRGDITLAAFLPYHFDLEGNTSVQEAYVAVLGRYIIKHSAAEIAAEGIAHELVGHGFQHRDGTLELLSGLDAECEASLYEMKVFQDLGVDMLSSHIVRFRLELEKHNCDDFKRFMGKRERSLMYLWDQKYIDVDRILRIFKDYEASLTK